MSIRSSGRFFAFLFSVTTARGIPIFIVPLYFVSVGIPIVDIGVALAVNGASILIFEVMWGFLVDQRDTEGLIPWIVILTVVTYVLLPYVRSPDTAIGAEFLLGATAPALAVVARSMVVRNDQSSGWAHGFGLLGSIFAFSFFVGSLIGSETGSLVGFSDSFYLAAIVTMVFYLLYVLGPRAGQTPLVSGTDIESSSTIGQNKGIAWSGLLVLCTVAVPSFMGLAFFTNLVQLVVTQTSISATALQAGFVVAAFYISTAVFAPLLPSRAANNARRWIALALLVNFAVFAFLTQAHDVWEVAAAAFAEGICYATISPLSLSLLMVEIPKTYVGRVMGVYGAAEDIGLIIGPLVASLLWIQVGLSYAYIALGVAYLVVLVPFALLMRRGRQRAKR